MEAGPSASRRARDGNNSGKMKKPDVVHHATPGNFKKRGKKMKKIVCSLLLKNTTEGVNKKSEILLKKY